MKICIFGAGYVGLVAAACFAESGNSVSSGFSYIPLGRCGGTVCGEVK